jgi:hypothetical protein
MRHERSAAGGSSGAGGLDVLREVVDRAIAGDGELVLIAGEPGIGKTRLAEEAVEYGRGRGTAILWGYGWDGDGAPAFWPWAKGCARWVKSFLAEAPSIVPGERSRSVGGRDVRAGADRGDPDSGRRGGPAPRRTAILSSSGSWCTCAAGSRRDTVAPASVQAVIGRRVGALINI